MYRSHKARAGAEIGSKIPLLRFMIAFRPPFRPRQGGFGFMITMPLPFVNVQAAIVQ